MAQDYAKRVLTTYKKPKKKKFHWEWWVIAFLSIAFIGYWGFLHKEKLVDRSQWLSFLRSYHTPKKPTTQVARQDNRLDELPIHFDFYNELPNQHVLGSNAVSNTPNPVPENHFVLLFGQFDNASEANQLRVSLLLANCEAEMVEIHTNRGTFFRVQKGPFMSQTEAKKIQASLEKKGVTSQINKV